MVQIFLPIVVYTQWIFKYIQPWNNVGKTAIEKQSTELAVANPVSNNREWEIVLLILSLHFLHFYLTTKGPP